VTSPQTSRIRKHVAVAFLLTVAGISAGETLEALLFPEPRKLASHVVTVAFAALVGTVAVWWTLRRQAREQLRATE